MANTVKACGCGRSFDATAWSALPLIGVQRDEDGDLEMRNCPCSSTLALPLCIAPDCTAIATWRPDARELDCYCPTHRDEWLRAEKRADFADSYAADYRAECERDEAAE